jgi:Zn ribbon nucleic-acid-binding protein
MSGHSYGALCPNCGEEMSAYTDHKPHDCVSAECLECGFEYWTKSEQMPLKALNERREQHNEDIGYEEDDEDFLKPLKVLPSLDEFLGTWVDPNTVLGYWKARYVPYKEISYLIDKFPEGHVVCEAAKDLISALDEAAFEEPYDGKN